MSGQSASLSIKEAKAMQECVQHPGSQAGKVGGPGKGGKKEGLTQFEKKVGHKG